MISWLRQIGPVTVVRGNVDDDEAAQEHLPETCLVEEAGWRLLVLHVWPAATPKGDAAYVAMNPNNQQRASLESNCFVHVPPHAFPFLSPALKAPASWPRSDRRSSSPHSAPTLSSADTATSLHSIRRDSCGSPILDPQDRPDFIWGGAWRCSPCQTRPLHSPPLCGD